MNILNFPLALHFLTVVLWIRKEVEEKVVEYEDVLPPILLTSEINSFYLINTETLSLYLQVIEETDIEYLQKCKLSSRKFLLRRGGWDEYEEEAAGILNEKINSICQAGWLVLSDGGSGGREGGGSWMNYTRPCRPFSLSPISFPPPPHRLKTFQWFSLPFNSLPLFLSNCLPTITHLPFSSHRPGRRSAIIPLYLPDIR